MWETVELHELRTFLVLAEELHFGRTAERLYLTQSRVSRSIQDLERRIGGKLFERSSRRVALSPLGVVLAERIRPHCDGLRTALAEVSSLAGEYSGVVRIGLVTTMAGGKYLPLIVRTFELRHPLCRVEVMDVGHDQPILPRLGRDVDLLAIRLPPSSYPGYVIGPVLAADARVLLVSKQHRLAERATVGFEDLAGERVADVQNLPRSFIEGLIPGETPSGQPIPLGPRLRSVVDIVHQVALGNIVHPSVESIQRYYRHPNVVAIPMPAERPSRSGLVWPEGALPVAVEAFVTVAREVLAEQDDDVG